MLLNLAFPALPGWWLTTGLVMATRGVWKGAKNDPFGVGVAIYGHLTESRYFKNC